MGKVYEQLDDSLIQFIQRQHLFFVGTAPTSLDGMLNLSPKGLDTFRILGPKSVAYLDLIGSGIETLAHLRQNGRLTLMFCALEGRPLILRLYGQGRAVEPGEPGWDDLLTHFPHHPATRSVVVMDIERIADSCGWGVPRYEYKGERDQLANYAETKGKEGLDRYKAEKNRASIDGFAGLRRLEGSPSSID
ncbi:Pyridoxamine 5'-phosphate oxidase [Singulisphaera sp. GP187]|uniref:pyridoxamine 5'-phosphate oxidase family protein n=1 Tax=Singulisphaera sp. GP187 TaxID=1882752 RepID=UPI000928F66B|nr:pyridoxamine 5'-phosphate oxidase family protein [Singulisphaera sp. GP187]SIN71573.1 Pyridoxamine 5'-phosphate oxidase [Singulisphaera sp. GP187]